LYNNLTKTSYARVAGKNKVVMLDEPKFAKVNSEKAVDEDYISLCAKITSPFI
jgi:hypothetical protein